MSFEDWIFALHLLTAATLVGGLGMSWIIFVALRSADTADATLSLHRVAVVATGAILAGLPGTIGLGIWLAILRPELHPWHGWAIAAIILWSIATTALFRAARDFARPVKKARELIASGQTGPSPELMTLNRSTTGLMFRALASGAIVLIVIDMVYKPGA